MSSDSIREKYKEYAPEIRVQAEIAAQLADLNKLFRTLDCCQDGGGTSALNVRVIG